MASPAMTGTSLGSESAVNRICFRGDLRPPSESYKHQFDENAGREPILTSAGFDARNQDATPVYRPKEGAAGDADPESGVCVTPRFAVAPLFPIQNFPWTWIYVVYVEKAYNTKMRQVIDSQQVMKNISSGTFLQNVVRYATLGCVDMRPTVDLQQAADIMWSLYGDELIVDRLPAGNIICAIKCKRLDYQTLKTNFKNGIRYELVSPIVPNVKCTLPQSVYMLGLEFLNDELNLHPTGTTPTVQTGFHASDPKSAA